MIVSIYQCDPEFRIFQILQELLAETGIDKRGIATKNIVMQGHPLFELQAKGSKNADSVFPRIGVDWLNEHDQQQDVGQNQHITHTAKEHPIIKRYQEQGSILVQVDSRRNLQAESEYEQVSHADYADFLKYNGYLEKYILHNQSTIMLTGWASGAHARKSAQWLYMAVKSTVPYLISEMRRRHRVAVEREGRPETNIRNMDLGHNLWGFELMLSVTQLIQVYRTLPNMKIPKHVDLHMANSRSGFLKLNELN